MTYRILLVEADNFLSLQSRINEHLKIFSNYKIESLFIREKSENHRDHLASLILRKVKE